MEVLLQEIECERFDQEIRKELKEEKELEVKNYLKKLLVKIEDQERSLAKTKAKYQESLNMDLDELFQIARQC